MPTSEPRFPAQFDSDVFNEDLDRSTRAGRAATRAARGEYASHGGPFLSSLPMRAGVAPSARFQEASFGV